MRRSLKIRLPLLILTWLPKRENYELLFVSLLIILRVFNLLVLFAGMSNPARDAKVAAKLVAQALHSGGAQ